MTTASTLLVFEPYPLGILLRIRRKRESEGLGGAWLLGAGHGEPEEATFPPHPLHHLGAL